MLLNLVNDSVPKEKTTVKYLDLAKVIVINFVTTPLDLGLGILVWLQTCQYTDTHL